MTQAVKVKGLTKSYNGRVVVDNLSLHVDEGEVLGLIGPNGAGKTTTIECVLGVTDSDDGEIRIFDLDPIRDRVTLFGRVGVQFQSSSYPDRIRVGEMCRLISALYEGTLDYRELLKEFSLIEKESSLVSSLSGGQEQRLSILLALINNPKMVFLDELTTGLDPRGRRDVWRYITKLKSEE